jgi:hypothetical protein
MSCIRLCDEQTDGDNDQNAQVSLAVMRILWANCWRIIGHHIWNDKLMRQSMRC